MTKDEKEETRHSLQESIYLIQWYSEYHGLKLNKGKTKYKIFTRKKKGIIKWNLKYKEGNKMEIEDQFAKAFGGEVAGTEAENNNVVDLTSNQDESVEQQEQQILASLSLFLQLLD